MPFFLMFGRQARLPVDLAFHMPRDQPVYHNQYVTKLQQTIQETYEHAQENLEHHLKKQKEIYNKKAPWPIIQ